MINSLFDRRSYPTLDKNIYLNQASLGLIGQPAVNAMHEFIDDFARHGNCFMSDKDEVAYLNDLRKIAATLFGCPSAHMAIVSGASEILAQIPLLIQLKVNSNIVVVSSDFPSITRPWLRQEALNNCQIRFVEDNSSEDLTDGLIEAIDENTSVVAVSNVQYATGTRVDIKRLSKVTSKVDAYLIVDVTQSAGARPLDVSTWNVDAVVSSGYKWLGGHGGVALAMMSPRFLENIPPITGWMGAPDPFNFNAKSILLSKDAKRYTQSTMPYASIACLSTAIEQLLILNISKIESHSRKLASLLIENASQIGWSPFRPLNSEVSSHIIALSHSEKSIDETIKILANHNIFCSSRGGRIRVSLAPYNDENDINKLIQVLKI